MSRTSQFIEQIEYENEVAKLAAVIADGDLLITAMKEAERRRFDLHFTRVDSVASVTDDVVHGRWRLA